MLISYSVKNYRSIKEKVTLSFLGGAMKDDLRFPAYFQVGKEKILKGIAVFGGNAAGKTSLTGSLPVFRDAVVESIYYSGEERNMAIQPYLFDKETEKAPTEFEIVFDKDGKRYFYCLALDKEKIRYEALDVRDVRRHSVFVRKDGEEARFSNDPKASRRAFFADFAKPNQPYVTLAKMFDVPVLKDVFYYLRDCVAAVPEDVEDRDRYIVSKMKGDKKYRAFLVDLLKASDLAIADIVPDLGYQGPPTGKLLAIHESGGRRIPIPVDEEPAGIKALVFASYPIYSALKEGKVLVYDEFGRSLYPELTAALLSLFFDFYSNPNKAQILFNTQEATLLEQYILRRDEVYMVENKGAPNGSAVVPLSAYRARKDDDLMHAFLNGRYVFPPVYDLISLAV